MTSSEKLAFRLNLIAAQVIQHRHPLPPFEIQIGGAPWRELPYNSYWGEWQRDFKLRGTYQIPADWPLEAPIALDLPLGDSGDSFQAHPEALIYVDGAPFTTVDVRHNRLILPDALKDHRQHDLLLDGWAGLGSSLEGDPRPRLYIQPCTLIIHDEATRQFVILARNIVQTIQSLPGDDRLAVALTIALRDALNRVDTRDPIGADFYASVPAALDMLREHLAALGPPAPLQVHAVGHAHIDTAWLWDLAQTRRKAARTFHTVLHLMDHFPDYHFLQSQPQLYAFVREDHPALFERIQAAVAAGRWEPIGGMWVEADCNITGAESLVRQFVFGRRYFREFFGADAETRVLWLPDTFGFPATLPQIMAEAGIPYFFTTKLRWGEYNDFPYDSFWWQGTDGTRVLAHITPTPMHGWLKMATYNAEADAQSLIETEQRLKMKDRQQVALMAYGWGDGGGGPDMTMLENLTVLRDFPGIPQAKPGTARTFYETLQDASGHGLPVWSGELYLETHQGTLTSQGWIKRANRKTEILLHAVELLATQAALQTPDYAYPRDAINAAWRILLLNQFHDILPGSSIGAVYDDARAQFTDITEKLESLRDAALAIIAGRAGGDWLVCNPIDFERPGIVSLPQTPPANTHLTLDGQPCILQPTADGALVALPRPLAPLETVALTLVAGSAPPVQNTLIARPDVLENDHLRATFDKNGHLGAIYDKSQNWHVLSANGNQLQFFEDRPLRFDAWNIDADYSERMWQIERADSIEVIETGPVRVTLRLTWTYRQSQITQEISLYRGGRALEVRNIVNWQERHTLMKVAFPVNIHADEATYHIQWGSVKRPTHRSTSWDAARYEVAAHHWADLNSGRRGVALLNDCKYAYDVQDNVMRLTLIKSATYPDPDADRGTHEFTYALLPHVGDLSRVWAAGYALNYPLLVTAAAGDGNPPPPLVTTEDGILLETIKQAEDSMNIVLRLLALDPADDETTIHLGFRATAAWRVNLLEDRRSATALSLRDDGQQITVSVRHHEIITLLIEPEQSR